MIDGGERGHSDGPHPNSLPCKECGHVWFAGERRHAYLDLGAGAEAQVLCVLCLEKRGLEHAEAPRQEHWG